MNDSIKQLLDLQEKDSELDRLRHDAALLPAKVTALKGDIQQNKTALEAAKKDLTALQLLKKQKDLDLDAREAAVRKHSGDLNAVKTNEAYKALLGEIEKAKQEKSALEDEILKIMDQIDQANKVWKEKESSAKGVEAGLLKQISDVEARQQELQAQITQKQADREAAASALPPALRSPYDRLRQNKRANAIVPIRNGQCAGCHMRVSPNLVNEITRGQKLMVCESCSRIVYIEAEPAEPKSAPAAS